MAVALPLSWLALRLYDAPVRKWLSNLKPRVRPDAALS
jgi:peptidoglycan/LPS O-acetylase OafA/YrhL